MHSISKILLKTALILTLGQAAQASIVINIVANRLDNQVGIPVGGGTLIQLVNLGADGVFNDITLLDGTTTGINQWVSGDDSVVNLAFTSSLGGEPKPGDFAS